MATIVFKLIDSDGNLSKVRVQGSVTMSQKILLYHDKEANQYHINLDEIVGFYAEEDE